MWERLPGGEFAEAKAMNNVNRPSPPENLVRAYLAPQNEHIPPPQIAGRGISNLQEGANVQNELEGA